VTHLIGIFASGYEVICPKPVDSGRPLCCGRTFFSSGMMNQANEEITRLLNTLEPYLNNGVSIVGLEPSCTLSMRDEIPLLTSDPRAKLLAEHSLLFEEFLAKEKPNLNLHPLTKKALLHGHCHQKAHDVMSAVETVLRMVPGLEVTSIESSCCGMAGSFGYAKDTVAVSKQMAEASLLPAVREADVDTLVIADGTSCRHQIELGANKQAIHVAKVLEMSLNAGVKQ